MMFLSIRHGVGGLRPPNKTHASNQKPSNRLAAVWLVLLAMISLPGCGQAPQVSQAADAQQTNFDVMRVGTFNMLRLGHGTSKNWQRLARVIDESDMHVFSGTEIMNADAAWQLRDALRAQTGEPWELTLSSEADGENRYKEYFAFYYRGDMLQPDYRQSTWCKSSVRASRQYYNGCYSGDERRERRPDFERDPYVGHFRMGDQAIALVGMHVYYGSNSQEDLAKRHHEMDGLRILLDDIRDHGHAQTVIAAGDFNLFLPDDRPGAARVKKEIEPEFFFEGDTLEGYVDGPTTTGRSSYDHIITFADNWLSAIPNSASTWIDFDLSNETQRKKFRKEVSDHFPAFVDFDVSSVQID